MKRLRRIKVGDEVKFTEDYLDFWHNEAFSMCSRPSGIQSDEEAKDYLIRKILSLGYRYKAVVTQLLEHTGTENGIDYPGFRVKIILPHGLVDSTIVSVHHVALYKKKRKS